MCSSDHFFLPFIDRYNMLLDLMLRSGELFGYGNSLLRPLVTIMGPYFDFLEGVCR